MRRWVFWFRTSGRKNLIQFCIEDLTLAQAMLQAEAIEDRNKWTLLSGGYEVGCSELTD
jgi:UV DNA damage repair endonuclease